MRFFLATTADIDYSFVDGKDILDYSPIRTVEHALPYGMGVELDEYCIAENLDDNSEVTDKVVMDKKARVGEVILHGPYNELCPAAIDPLVRKVAYVRYEQALEKARMCGAGKIVIHAGHNPLMYFVSFFKERSVEFWKRFLQDHPGDYEICLENVMEDDPSILYDIAQGVDDPRFRLCLDVGHANLTKTDVMTWLRVMAPKLSHLHVHNNNGRTPADEVFSGDRHAPPGDGVIDMKLFLDTAQALCPDITATVECNDLKSSVEWLETNGYISRK